MPGVAGWLRAWGAPDGAAGSASGRWSEGGGEAEPADQRLQVTVRAAVPPDRGVRARGDGGQRVAQDRPGRPGRGGIAAVGRLDDRDEEPEAAVASCSSQAARARRRRSQPRTVAAGTPRSAPSRAEPVPCSTDKAAARAITPTASVRRGAAHDGSRMCVAPHDRHKPRRGRSRCRRPPAIRISRSRPCPHGRSRPAWHDGQASAPDARATDAASASVHSSIRAVLPGHGTTIPGRQGAIRVAGSQPGPCRATRIRYHQRKRHDEQHDGTPQGPDLHQSRHAHGVVAHQTRSGPPARDRDTHGGRRQTAFSCSKRTPSNRPAGGQRSAPDPGPVGNRRRAVTPSARHAAWLPNELRDAREPPICSAS